MEIVRALTMEDKCVSILKANRGWSCPTTDLVFEVAFELGLSAETFSTDEYCTIELYVGSADTAKIQWSLDLPWKEGTKFPWEDGVA